MPEGDGTKYGKYVISDLIMPESKHKIDADYRKYARRIRWIDDDMVPGTFHMNTAWYLKAGPTLETTPHVHDSDELIGFFGSDPEDPDDLGGEVSIRLGDEEHIITRSTIIFVPAGLVHCPLVLNRVDKPIFHFTTVNIGQYNVLKPGAEAEV
jgi:hypothetical protein